jgi:methionine biosynthesis protein MetW
LASGVARNAEGVRWDHLFIVDVVPPGARVLDLGCGRGTLLKMLVDQKQVRGTGIEIVEEKVYDAVAKGVTVYHGDFDEGLGYYPDNSFDYIILSQTLQEARETVAVLTEALRVGHFVVASFPNFGHWKARLQLLATGRAPVTESLPYQWYNTPNIHSLTIKDFRAFAREQHIRIVRHFYVGAKRPLRFWPNARATYGVFVLEKLPG